MEGSEVIYNDDHFSVELIKKQLAVQTKAKILQIFFNKSFSIHNHNATPAKQKIALPPFVVRYPEEVPLAISLIKEKSEEFQHKFKLTTAHPKQYSDARLAMSILDPEVVKHILSCFTKGKLKEMEGMTKTLTNRHKNRNGALNRYLAKIEEVSATVSRSEANIGELEEVDEVRIFKKTALVDSNSSSTAFRLDATAKCVSKQTEDNLEKFKNSRKLKLKALVKLTDLHLSDVDKYTFKVTKATDNLFVLKDFKRKNDDDTPNGSAKRFKSTKPKLNYYNGSQDYRGISSQKKVDVYETVQDIMAQFEPCSEFIVENDRTIDKYDCRVCDIKVIPKMNQNNKNALTAHYRNVHAMERHYQCSKCDMILPSIDVWFLERHRTSNGCMPRSGESKPSVISCEKCGQKFNKGSSYADHYKKTHTSIFKDYYKKRVICDGCGLKFTNQNMLSMHEVFEQKLCKVPCSVCKEIIEVKLNCKLEKMFKESGLVDNVKCKSCNYPVS